MKRPLMLIIALLLTVSASLFAADKTIEVDHWLTLEGVITPMPAFNSEQGFKTVESDLLLFEHFDKRGWWPHAGQAIPSSGKTLKWQNRNGADLKLSAGRESNLAWAASYISVDRWVKLKINISGNQLFAVFVDGESLGNQTSAVKSDTASQTVSKEIELERGKHFLLVKTLRSADGPKNWSLSGTLSYKDDDNPAVVQTTVSAKRSIKLHDLLDRPNIGSVAISADGKLAAIALNQMNPQSAKRESWLEIRSTNGKLVETYRGKTALSHVTWLPQGHVFSYTENNDGKTTLWRVDLDRGTTETVFKDIEHFSSYEWAPNGKFLIYALTTDGKKPVDGLKRIDGMADHWPGFRDRDHLYRMDYPSGLRQRLTNGSLSSKLAAISPDSKRLLITRQVYDYAERPYSKNTLYALNLESMKLDSLWSGRWFNSAQWSPDGKQLLMLGGPSQFGKLGREDEQAEYANEYDTQAYLFDLKTKKPLALTKNFNPAITGAQWVKSGLYISAYDGSFKRLFKLDTHRKGGTILKTGMQAVTRFDVARDAATLVFSGSDQTRAHYVKSMDLKNEKTRTLSDPAAAFLSDVAMGKVDDWSFINTRGTTIQGRVYYPPDFDDSKKYPAIVYYYSGVVPTTRDFGGRYPKNYYAANGYVVYVLQPSGAVGYGQKFSALHVNDWGKIVADEIIDGVKQFLAAHPFVDAKRVGCMGASYGGFMTELLQTRTDIFAAAVSHAGISSLSSYWGEGYWGTLYSAVATANSFPWNRKDIYVDQSALFNADKINTPLLMMHGNADHNVPPGESRQLYAALKLLGKEVELIEVDGQDHWILDYKKRLRWKKSIMAWFDKQLKNQPQWWDALYN